MIRKSAKRPASGGEADGAGAVLATLLNKRTVLQLLAAAVLLSLIMTSCERRPDAPRPQATRRVARRSDVPRALPIAARSPTQRMGCVFTKCPNDPYQTPRLTEIPIPHFYGAYAIWGATGRDDQSHIWFGVSATGVPTPSAHLMEYNPIADQLVDRGNAVDQLKRCELLRDGECQMKIHSKPYQADDGAMYFASMDERGEKDDGSVYPNWGGHLWRLRPGQIAWEHLLATREALIAVGSTGRWVCALGYFGHVLYQFDTETEQIRHVEVGSVDAHVSRNLCMDLNGHVYVPRVTEVAADQAHRAAVTKFKDRFLRTALVEYDENLDEVQEVPFDDYKPTTNSASHGIIGFCFMADGRIALTAGGDAFWVITPSRERAATIQRLGWFHPEGDSYASALYTYAGKRFVCGLTRRNDVGYEWVVYDLKRNEARALQFDSASQTLLKNRKGLLLYGTNTRDDMGGAYLVGRYVVPGHKWPIVLRAQLPRGTRIVGD